MPPKIVDVLSPIDSIKLWLKYNERSQAWLARKVDISPEHLNRILNKHVPLHKNIENKLIEIIGK